MVQTPGPDNHQEFKTVAARDCFRTKALVRIFARARPVVEWSSIDPPMDPPLAFEPARGRSKRFENALDERDPWRLPGEERAIVSRGVADESAV